MIAMGFRNPLHHAVQREASEVVRHFALRNVIGLLPGEYREMFPQISIGETTRQQTKPDQQMPEGQYTEVRNAQSNYSCAPEKFCTNEKGSGITRYSGGSARVRESRLRFWFRKTHPAHRNRS